MAKAVTIGLQLPQDTAYGRGIARGILTYGRSRDDWMLDIQQEIRRFKRHSHLAGIIGQLTSDEQVSMCSELGVPIVTVSNAPLITPLPQVVTDDVAVGRMAARHFLDRHLKQFGYVGYPPHRYARMRKQGFVETLREAGYDCLDYHGGPWETGKPAIRTAITSPQLQQWIDELPKPVGIFCFNDGQASWVATLCKLADLRIPDDVAILGVDNNELNCELRYPTLSSIALPLERIGYEAATMLDRLIARKQFTTDSIALPPVGVVARMSSDIFAVDDPDIAAALRYIRDNVGQPISVDDVVDHTAVSRRGLERRFKKMIGRSLLAEIFRVRLERAKELLAGTDLPIPQIAVRSGFSTREQFTRFFHSHAGQPPTTYRVQVRLSAAAAKHTPVSTT